MKTCKINLLDFSSTIVEESALIDNIWFKNMGFIVWLITLVAAALGTVLGEFIISIDLIGIPELVSAIIWFLIAFTTYFFGKRLDEEHWFKLVSINFIVTWAFCTVGYLLGLIVWNLIDQGAVAITLDQMVTFFFIALPLTIGPTATVSLGLRD